MKRLALRLLAVLGAAVVLLLPLAIPPADPAVASAPDGAQPFVWANDSGWRALEARFAALRGRGCDSVSAGMHAIDTLELAWRALGTVADTVPAGSDALVHLESRLFAAAPYAAACDRLSERYVRLTAAVRERVKAISAHWDLGDRATRDRLYRLLYGTRAAAEEVMLQQPERAPALVRGSPAPSATPSAEIRGVTLHSGDILVSRGGYPTSALIARGNDYPGNFSHIALVHVDSASRAITVVEAHIELGVAITTADGYLADKKLRVMVLRPRAELPALVADPLLPHKAATAMLERARREHIPYDFTMDYTDASKLFCSEVASQAYRDRGLTLWTGISTIARPGLRRWLASFGVQRFETQEPSDLEYDPQLHVVAEWRDSTALVEDHVDNAVTDVMLERADLGDPLAYPWYQLPVARVMKGWSWLNERVGRTGPIPEGMSPAAALRNRAYSAWHDRLAHDVSRRAAEWERQRGYAPPYWVLVDLAREAVSRPPD